MAKHETGTRAKISSLLAGAALLVALAWLFRGVLFLSQYSVQIVWTVAILVLLSNAISVRLDQGVSGLFSSLASGLGSASVELSILFLLGGFLGLESIFTDYTLTLFVAGLLLFMASWLVGRLVTPKRPILERHIARFSDGEMELAHGLKVRAQQLQGLPISVGRRSLGCVAINDMDFHIESTLGPVRIPARAPVLILTPMLRKGERVRDVTQEEYDSAWSLYSTRTGRMSGTFIRIPFVNIRAYDDYATEVELGPLRISDTDEGTVVDIPPFVHVVDDTGPRRRRVLVASASPHRTTIISTKGKTKARWNGWRIKTDGQSYTVLRRGSSYAKDGGGNLVVGSLGYELTVSKENVAVQLPDVELVATPRMLIVTTEGETQRIADERLSRRFIDSMVEVAKSQVSDLLSGAEVDPAEAYVAIDSLLHGVK